MWRAITFVLALILVGAIAFGGYRLYRKVMVAMEGEGCSVRAPAGTVELELDQAPNAATIAAVAYRKKLPERALVIAYATAEQESKIENLGYGDRDSVGIFQQRPSQGWGRPDQLQDPVYASNRFFDALVKVEDYTKKKLHVAAQDVQRSADGRLYAQHEPMAKILATGFRGVEPAAVTCWYPSNDKPLDKAKAFRELRRAFGSRVLPTEAGDGVKLPPGASPQVGWSMASWAVTHAHAYGLTEVRYGKKRWSPQEGHDGWTDEESAPADRVLIG